MRLFIAIQLSEGMRQAICALQERFRENGVTGKYTRPENLHLTLAFIGEYADTGYVLDAIGSVRLTPFTIRLQGLGAFNDLWWVGLADSEPLRAYVRALRHALADAGIPFDRKGFKPHITILRRADPLKRVKVEAAPGEAMLVDHVSLMRSDRGKKGMIYTEITE